MNAEHLAAVALLGMHNYRPSEKDEPLLNKRKRNDTNHTKASSSSSQPHPTAPPARNKKRRSSKKAAGASKKSKKNRGIARLRLPLQLRGAIKADVVSPVKRSPSKDVSCVSNEHKDLRSVRFAATSHTDKLAQGEYQLSLKSHHQFVVATAKPNHGHPADAPLEQAVVLPPTKQNSGQLLVPTLASAKPPPLPAVGDTSTFLAQNSFAAFVPQLKNAPGSQHVPPSFLQNNGGDPTTAYLLDQIMASLQQIFSPKNSSSPPVVSDPSLLSLDQQQSQLMLSNFLGNPMMAMSSGTRPQAAGPPPPLLVPQHHQQLQEPISPHVLSALSSLLQQKQQQPPPPQQQCPSTTLPPDLASALLAAVLLQE